MKSMNYALQFSNSFPLTIKRGFDLLKRNSGEQWHLNLQPELFRALPIHLLLTSPVTDCLFRKAAKKTLIIPLYLHLYLCRISRKSLKRALIHRSSWGMGLKLPDNIICTQGLDLLNTY